MYEKQKQLIDEAFQGVISLDEPIKAYSYEHERLIEVVNMVIREHFFGVVLDERDFSATNVRQYQEQTADQFKSLMLYGSLRIREKISERYGVDVNEYGFDSLIANFFKA